MYNVHSVGSGASVAGSDGMAMVLGGGIEPERLQVSYYELYYHRVSVYVK